MSKSFQNPEKDALEDDLNKEELKINFTLTLLFLFSSFLHLCEQNPVNISE